MLEISPNAKISPLAEIEDSVRGTRIIISDGVTIDAFVKIKPVGGTGDFSIGENSYINSGTVIYTGNGIRIGKNVLIAANCTFAATSHEYQDKEKLICQQRFRPSKGGIIIEDDVWIGAGAILLDGTVIRTGAVVGAGSLVRGVLEPYRVYGGNPIRLLGERK